MPKPPRTTKPETDSDIVSDSDRRQYAARFVAALAATEYPRAGIVERILAGVDWNVVEPSALAAVLQALVSARTSGDWKRVKVAIEAEALNLAELAGEELSRSVTVEAPKAAPTVKRTLRSSTNGTRAKA